MILTDLRSGESAQQRVESTLLDSWTSVLWAVAVRWLISSFHASLGKGDITFRLMQPCVPIYTNHIGHELAWPGPVHFTSHGLVGVVAQTKKNQVCDQSEPILRLTVD